MVLIQRDAYVDLLHGSNIDIAVSPQHATISALLTHVRRGNIANVYSLRGGSAEAIEIAAQGDEKSSKVVGRTIKSLKLPPGANIGAIVRGNEVIIAHSNTKILSEDQVIIFLVNKRYISEVEALFQLDALSFY